MECGVFFLKYYWTYYLTWRNVIIQIIAWKLWMLISALGRLQRLVLIKMFQNTQFNPFFSLNILNFRLHLQSCLFVCLLLKCIIFKDNTPYLISFYTLIYDGETHLFHNRVFSITKEIFSDELWWAFEECLPAADTEILEAVLDCQLQKSNN